MRQISVPHLTVLPPVARRWGPDSYPRNHAVRGQQLFVETLNMLRSIGYSGPFLLLLLPPQVLESCAEPDALCKPSLHREALALAKNCVLLRAPCVVRYTC